MEPDAEGLLLSETTRLRFGVSPDGQDLVVIDEETGDPLLSEMAVAQQARRETQARMEAEEEIVHLRAEIERLRGGS